ncbi:hypothetical protein VR20_279 [Escherichia phage vB_EcoM_VR20]|uniref:Uncharacterized protein n=1 Tax=Escherichia phage vB_EcoM_VR20 TaxID=1567027 RepID=A0A0A7HC83_9CAUD|nr:hypothetical protein AVV68_gp154 [Escherichia phage vB_EcoM_VR20]AIZ02337.1 hypothetical protein VR20_279 [Escherichia phage vB_EcoM_VR20]
MCVFTLTISFEDNIMGNRIYKVKLHGKVIKTLSFNAYISADCARDILIEEGYSKYIQIEEVL